MLIKEHYRYLKFFIKLNYLNGPIRLQLVFDFFYLLNSCLICSLVTAPTVRATNFQILFFMHLLA